LVATVGIRVLAPYAVLPYLTAVVAVGIKTVAPYVVLPHLPTAAGASAPSAGAGVSELVLESILVTFLEMVGVWRDVGEATI
jgi:hypothetical protein